MFNLEAISLFASIVAILTSLAGIWYQTKMLKQRDEEIRHKVELDWKEFREKYTSTETRMYDWLEDLDPPDNTVEENAFEIGFPYLAGAPIRQPDLFYGRRKLTSQAIKCANGKQMASMSVLGARKAGKTSFLRFLEFSLSDQYTQIVPVYLDAQTPFNDCENFYAYMLRETMQSLEKRNKNIARYPDLPKAVPFEMLGDFLECASGMNWRFVMLLDEFENMVKEGSPFDEKFFASLRSLIQRGYVSWVTASYRFVYMPNTKTSPFSNIIQEVHHIGPISINDAKRLVIEPAARYGHFFSTDDVDFVISIAGRIPFMLQKAALLLYKTHLDGIRDKAAHTRVYNAFSVEMQNYFDSQLSNLTPKEYKTLLQVFRKFDGGFDLQAISTLDKYGFIEKVSESNEYKVLGQVFDDYLNGHARSIS